MKVLLFNGSSNEHGCTYTALEEAASSLKKNGIETEIIQVGKNAIRDCIGCGGCRKNGGKCVFKDDIVNEVIEKAKDADGFIFGSPVYYAHPSGRLLSFMDRLFYSEANGNGNKLFYMKPAAAVVSARRAGNVTTFDQINKYFTISQMPIVSSRYWNMVFGATVEDVLKDEEGLYTMRVLARNMAFMLKCKEAGLKAGVALPKQEPPVFTNFIKNKI